MIRGTKTPIHKINPQNPQPIKAAIHNRFDIEVVDSLTGQLKTRAVGLNTVCNQLWTRLLGWKPYFNYIHYGIGTGTPSTGDSSLFSYLGGASAGNFITDLDFGSGVYSCKGSIQLSASTAVGKTLTEVGIAYDSGASTLCTHAMLKDMNGNPISIEKTGTDVINIYATVFVHFDPAGYSEGAIRLVDGGSTMSNGTTDLLRLLSGKSSNEGLVLNRAFYTSHNSMGCSKANSGWAMPSGDSQDKSITRAPNVSSRTITLTVGRLEANQCNVGGLLLVILGSVWNSDTKYFVPNLVMKPGGSWWPGSTIENEPVGTGDGQTKDFGLDFPFAHDVKVYIDGVETSGFTVDYAPNATNWVNYMEALQPESTPDNHITRLSISQYSYFNEPQLIFYNPAWEVGISSISKRNTYTIYTSDNLKDWVKLSSGAVPIEYAHNKYWRIDNTGTSSGNQVQSITPVSSFTGKTLHLAEAPPSGAVITADYTCDVIAKDANHVFDMTVTIQLAEYTEAQ